jgi:hypothetical protein
MVELTNLAHLLTPAQVMVVEWLSELVFLSKTLSSFSSILLVSMELVAL